MRAVLVALRIDARRLVLPSYRIVAVLLGIWHGRSGGVRTPGVRRGWSGGVLRGLPRARAGRPGAPGYGDVKLAGLLGLVLGWCGLHSWRVDVCAPFLLAGMLLAVVINPQVQ